MEPIEPIRGRQQSGHPTDRRIFGSWRTIALGVADFIMCFFALGGLLDAALGVAFFTDENVRFRLPWQVLESPTQRMEWIAFYSATSLVGFAYMLWRYRWRCRLSTLFKIMALCCVAIAAFKTAVWSVPVFGLWVFGYTVTWTCRPKGLPE